MKWLCLTLLSFSLFAKEPHPITRVNQWFNEEKELTEGRFFTFGTLASVSSNGRPHSRTIEISHFDKEKGALFFTHKQTQKVEDFLYNPYASLTVWLPKTHRQLIIEGKVEEISRGEAEKSWKKMPRFMKLSFLTSNHQGKLESEEILEKRKKTLEKDLPKEIPIPETFIGYRLKPDQIIFYQVNFRSFPKKEAATLEKDDWVTALLEP